MKLKKYILLSGLLALMNVTSYAQGFAGGSGSITDPYLISTVAHMQSMHTADYTNAVYYKLTADIDMQGVNWMPVNGVDPYNKVLHFDGNGRIIKNLTVIGVSYASVFGVLCGSVKNLGVINADIESTSGAGIIAGYAGTKTPASPDFTGTISNCYTTGRVLGSDAVGGIVGNVGKPNGSSVSGVRNCYSTADVMTFNVTGNSRAGGIAGIVFAGGVLENSYATGTITSAFYGAGGVVGWTDSNVKGVVALNDSVINTSTGNIGRISAFMGRVDGIIAQGEKCWAHDAMIVKDVTYLLVEADFKQGEVVDRNTPYDGVTKSTAFLSDPMNYFLELDWDFASDNNIWAQTMSSGKPIFQWLYDRGDYALIDGHTISTAVRQTQLKPGNMQLNGRTLTINSESKIDELRVYSLTGQLHYHTTSVNAISANVELATDGVFVISVLSDKIWSSAKLIIK